MGTLRHPARQRRRRRGHHWSACLMANHGKHAQEQELEESGAKKVRVRLKNLSSYHHLEDDKVKHSGDVVEVLERRAVALIEQGLAEPIEAKKGAAKRRSK